MSLMGHKRTWRDQIAMSALPSKPDIRPRDQDVCFGPVSDVPGSDVQDRLASLLRAFAINPAQWRALRD
jgi:hypothetical protein